MKRNRIPGGLLNIHTCISREQEKLLSKIAKKKDISRAELIRTIIEKYLMEKI